jgi:hypothetical protein
MTLKQLNEQANFNFEDGIVVYLDKQNKTFRFATDKETERFEKRGLTHTISSKDDYRKLAKKYDIDVSMKDWIEISNQAKRKNKDADFRRALAAMQKDVMTMSKED